eukprot:gnl/Hemi2/20471_TR6796_c0_g1_i1.p1 gnl/Hemi2/20471_TR6796_c0_g1~~gnl/Hemi2/20471_TR6796_c0_g1_i1.p1  ORF type:complete len:590 (+),score=196.19 gnl/Hemi2/20471_TR6796_c0_g1_i1:44-1771(+)
MGNLNIAGAIYNNMFKTEKKDENGDVSYDCWYGPGSRFVNGVQQEYETDDDGKPIPAKPICAGPAYYNSQGPLRGSQLIDRTALLCAALGNPDRSVSVDEMMSTVQELVGCGLAEVCRADLSDLMDMYGVVASVAAKGISHGVVLSAAALGKAMHSFLLDQCQTATTAVVCDEDAAATRTCYGIQDPTPHENVGPLATFWENELAHKLGRIQHLSWSHLAISRFQPELQNGDLANTVYLANPAPVVGALCGDAAGGTGVVALSELAAKLDGFGLTVSALVADYGEGNDGFVPFSSCSNTPIADAEDPLDQDPPGWITDIRDPSSTFYKAIADHADGTGRYKESEWGCAMSDFKACPNAWFRRMSQELESTYKTRLSAAQCADKKAAKEFDSDYHYHACPRKAAVSVKKIPHGIDDHMFSEWDKEGMDENSPQSRPYATFHREDTMLQVQVCIEDGYLDMADPSLVDYRLEYAQGVCGSQNPEVFFSSPVEMSILKQYHRNSWYWPNLEKLSAPLPYRNDQTLAGCISFVMEEKKSLPRKIWNGMFSGTSSGAKVLAQVNFRYQSDLDVFEDLPSY